MARKRFNFWLDDKRSDDWQVNELITTLKRAGQFTRAIREGLRLWVDLRAGNTAVLIELFPFIKEKLTPPAPTPNNGGGQSELAKEIAAQIILQGGSSGYVMQSSLPMPQKPAAPPTVQMKPSASVSADTIADNFLAAFD